MAKNIQEIPYTEGIERTLSLGRIAGNAVEKVRGTYQDVYLREIPSRFDWDFLLTSSALTTIAQYNLSNCSVNTGDTAITFASDVVLTAAFTSRKIKINGSDEVYTLTFSNTTAGTLNPPYQAPANAVNAAYNIFQDTYALAADFDRFPKNGGVYKWSGGKKEPLKEDYYQQALESFTSSPSTPDTVRLVGQDTAGNQLIQFFPPPSTARNYGYDYIRELRPLVQTTGLLLALSANQTTVIGLPGRALFNNTTTGDWLRVDELGKGQDSEWYRIIAIANDSSLTLAANFANTAITSSANFTIARAPEMPNRLHHAVLYGALRSLTQDQNDPQFAVYNARYAEALTDAKRIHVTRVSPQNVSLIAEEYLYRF